MHNFICIFYIVEFDCVMAYELMCSVTLLNKNIYTSNEQISIKKSDLTITYL